MCTEFHVASIWEVLVYAIYVDQTCNSLKMAEYMTETCRNCV